jgi:pilus assembly protein CpaE
MPVYLFSPELDLERAAAVERKLRAAIPDLMRVRQIDEIAQDLRGSSDESVFVLLVSFVGDAASLTSLVEAALRQGANVVPIMISDEISATDYKRLLRAGLVDWVSADAAPRDILEIISRRREDARDSAQARADRRVPVVASFVPCAGGVGNATLAVEVATYLKTAKATSVRDICIVDLDFQTSHVCDYLDIEPRFQIEEISNNPGRLDDQLLDINISRHGSGLHVFAAPRTRFNICELNVSALDALFDLISARYDLIVIDFPATWFAWTSQMIAGSDGVLVTGVNTVPALRLLAETVAAVRDRKHPAAPVAVALNRCERTLLGGVARRHHVEKVLGDETTIFYVHEEPMMLQSINAGSPLALNRTARKTVREIALIAEFCSQLKSTRTAALAAARRD